MLAETKRAGDGMIARRLGVPGYDRILLLIAGALMVASVFLPFWGIGMRAPQYPERALTVLVYADRMAGDLYEFNILNQYVGVEFPESLPETRFLPGIIVGLGAIAGLLALLPEEPRRKGILILLALVIALMLVGAVDLQWRLYRVGHDLDPNAPMKGVGAFTPPILGPNKVGNFRTFSYIHFGSVLFLLGGVCAFVARKSGSRRSRRFAPGDGLSQVS